MGEAKRRAKLDPNFGQRYPAQEQNWIFDSANDEIVVGNLNDCLSIAGITNTDNYRNQYIDLLTKKNLNPTEKFALSTSLQLDRRVVDDQQYQILFEQAVQTGSIFVVFSDDYPDECCHHIYYNQDRAQMFRNQGY
mgnify:CR=1 FL=1